MKMPFKALTVCAILSLAGAMAVGKPAMRGFRTFTQPDGTVVELEKVGDERGHVYLTRDGNVAMPFNGAFYYAEASTTEPGTLASTGMMVGRDAAPATAGLAVLEQVLCERQARTRFNAPARIPGGSSMLDSNVPTTGQQRGLVILVEYKDVKFTLDDPAAYYDRFMHEAGFRDYGATGSANEYFRESSRNRYDPQFDVYGPVTLSQNRSFYGGNNSYGEDKNPEQMVIDAVRALDEQVDYSLYDTDSDGYIDNVTIIYAGQGEADYGPEESVWPHMYWIYEGAGKRVVVDSKVLNRYNCINEWGKDSPDGIGTFCHEFSHVLGLPDLYDTSHSSYTTYTPSEWDVMDYGPYNNNGNTPPYHSIYEAYCLGWSDPELLPADYRGALEASSGQGFLVETERNNEFFMLEARNREGFDAYLPADGMLVWHIDYSKSVWESNSPNNDRNHMRCYIVPADNRFGSSSIAGDAFPGKNGTYTEFVFGGSPSFESWAGQDVSRDITSIVRSADCREVTFNVGNGASEITTVSFEEPTPNPESVLLAWNASAEASAYEVRLYNETRQAWQPGHRLISTLPSSIESRTGVDGMTVNGLEEDAQYTAWVRVVGDNGRSNWSDPVTFTAQTTGIETIVGEDVNGFNDGVERLYDLRGVRISNPAPGTIYIRVLNGKAQKIVAE